MHPVLFHVSRVAKVRNAHPGIRRVIVELSSSDVMETDPGPEEGRRRRRGRSTVPPTTKPKEIHMSANQWGFSKTASFSLKP